ncbi:hypothetical protein AMATHDRAFT_74476 [Amanita thiersii Skay4041]|uniref:Uncharacterized protein n=1 Tax=Amanita thiersii Skay4041 TaxID=703135 RepID=A0A2A9NWP9_9AGAR|nr:hypothetical protein AMATHDRAFT_74476 [Amanita thiersii Skay4041]
MSHTSPAGYLVWSIFSCSLLVFLLYHLWSFDKFKCLKWNNGPHSGAFKRVMTYSYLTSVPLIAAFSLGFTVIKYRQGFVMVPGHGIIPKPYLMWPQASKDAIFPLTLIFSIAWGLEMVTHLEELCFWLFLLNAGSTQRDWFRTWYFRVWMVGSTVAVVYMPLVSILTRSKPHHSEACVFLAGSLGSLCITLCFLPILWMFPRFLENLKSEEVDNGTLVRLTKFSELNRLRVLLRFVFILPLLILGVDGMRPDHHLNENFFVTDFLVILSGVGCLSSSAITLIIFFPRSIEGEIAERDAARLRKKLQWESRDSSYDARIWVQTELSYDQSASHRPISSNHSSPFLTSSSVKLADYTSYPDDDRMSNMSPVSMDKALTDDESDYPSPLQKLPPLRPNRRRAGGVEVGGFDLPLSGRNMMRRYSKVNPMVQNFKSPIGTEWGNIGRLSFHRP